MKLKNKTISKNDLKQNQSQLVLTFKTRDPNYEHMINIIEGKPWKLKKKKIYKLKNIEGWN
jgi:hypothetical protein